MTTDRCTLEYVLPLAEVVTDFFNEVKGRSKGYASMEYMLLGPQESDLVRLDVKINGEFAEPLATICHRCAPARARHACCALECARRPDPATRNLDANGVRGT